MGDVGQRCTLLTAPPLQPQHRWSWLDALKTTDQAGFVRCPYLESTSWYMIKVYTTLVRRGEIHEQTIHVTESCLLEHSYTVFMIRGLVTWRKRSLYRKNFMISWENGGFGWWSERETAPIWEKWSLEHSWRLYMCMCVFSQVPHS